MSVDVMRSLLDGLKEATADSAVKVIVLTGAGDRAFSAGGDLFGGFVDEPVIHHNVDVADQAVHHATLDG